MIEEKYTGGGALLRVIIPKKALPNQRLSADETTYNQRLSSVRVVCENFYGRLRGSLKFLLSGIEVPKLFDN